MKKVLLILSLVLCIFVFTACDGTDVEDFFDDLTNGSLEATFMADDEIVEVVKFEKDVTELQEPTIPAKLGYNGAWEDYTLENKDLTIKAVYTVDENFLEVGTADDFMEALENKKDNILISSDINLELSEALFIDYDVTIAGGHDACVNVTRAEEFVVGNDNIVISADGVVIANITFDFDIDTGYGISVGMGGGKYPSVVDDSSTIDSFTIKNVKLHTKTTLSTLYIGNSYYTGNFVIENCKFDGGAVSIVSDHLVDATFNINYNEFSNEKNNMDTTNYFFIYSPNASSADGLNIENVKIYFTNNTLSGKSITAQDTWKSSGVENHLFENESVEFITQNNKMEIMTQDELNSITDSINGEESFYITDGFSYSFGGNSYESSDLKTN